jgi:hypothetical protein
MIQNGECVIEFPLPAKGPALIVMGPAIAFHCACKMAF